MFFNKYCNILLFFNSYCNTSYQHTILIAILEKVKIPKYCNTITIQYYWTQPWLEGSHSFRLVPDRKYVVYEAMALNSVRGFD